MLTSSALLSHLKDEVNELIPECAIQVGYESPAWSDVSVINIERLHHYLKLQYPEAGPRYWSARSWGLLIWQPIYLAVIAAHRCGVVLPLSEMGQVFPQSGIPSGVLFRRCQFSEREIPECTQQMAMKLLMGCRNIYAVWNLVGLTRKNAERVVADCVLSALLMVYPSQVDAAETYGNLWLSAMGLQGAAGFIRYNNSAGEPRLALDKKNCCFRYLCNGRSPCDVCPRQTLGERLQRFSQMTT